MHPSPGKSMGRSTSRAVSQGSKALGKASSSLRLEFVALGMGLRFVELSDTDQARFMWAEISIPMHPGASKYLGCQLIEGNSVQT